MTKPRTDTEIVDAIAVGLGTQDGWSGADTLEWIADVIGQVRPHPGNGEATSYLDGFVEATTRDPLASPFLRKFVSEDAEGDEDDEL